MASNGRRRAATATSNFGVSRRENHDASAFYERFSPPEVSADDTVLPPFPIDDPFRVADARAMSDLPDGSVALVVTSPPYFAGKQYEQELSREGIPASYREYLDLLRGVFRECERVLEPGGRIAVNVANLGRKPYRSLSADVIAILQDELGLLLRGEVLWQKAAGAGGNCAWGSFRQATNPSLRDLTERVVIASKGRFDRAVSVDERRARGLPHRSSVTADEFMAATLDVWQIPPESARRVGHPAPFPVALPERLILLYTYEDDLVLDPFLGVGSALVAAARHDRRYVGYDLDPAYVAIAERRVADELASKAAAAAVAAGDAHPRRNAAAQAQVVRARDAGFQRRAVAEGKATPKLAVELLEDVGFEPVAEKRKLGRTGADIRLVMADADGHPWLFEVAGAYTTMVGGLRRADTLWRMLGKAHTVAATRPALGEWRDAPLVVLASHLPVPGSEGDTALRAAGPGVVFDAVELFDPVAVQRLRLYAKGGHHTRPAPGFWAGSDLAE